MFEFIGWSLCLLLLFVCFADSRSRLTWLSMLSLFSLVFSTQRGLMFCVWAPLVLVSLLGLIPRIRQTTTTVLSIGTVGLVVGLFVINTNLRITMRDGMGIYFPVELLWVPVLYLVAGFFAAYRDGGIALGVYVFGSVLFCQFWMPYQPVMVGWTILFFAAGLCALTKSRTRSYILLSSLVLGVSVTFWLSSGITKWKNRMATPEIAALQEEYPVENLEQRLAYEAPHRIKLSPTEKQPWVEVEERGKPETVSETVEQQLAEPQRHNFQRLWSLQSLMKVHKGEVMSFVLQDGFGVGRVVGPSLPYRDQITLPEPKPIPLAAKPESFSAETTGDDWQQDLTFKRGSPQLLATEHLSGVHVASITDFANPWRYGYVRSLQKTVGMQPHAFTNLPRVPNSDAQRWKVTRVDLVSLLKYETPRVYLSENLPRMEELADAPTRDLDSFEKNSLKQLSTGEDLVVARRSNEIRMVGSIRSGKQCMKCHQVKHGTLLGAFSYQLRQVPAVPEKEPKHDPRVSLLLLSK